MSISPTIQAALDGIAADLLAQARHDAQGLYWLTPPGLPTAEPTGLPDESLFSGSTGIVLFFVALSQHSGQPAHRRAAEAGTRWLVAHAHAHPPQNRSFFSGRLGIVYLCCKLYEATGNAAHLRAAQRLARAMRAGLLAGNASPDLLGGEAGSLFVVTYLYHLTGAALWRPVLAAGLARLVRGARPSRQGLKWGYQPNVLDSLTGLSHGASGIAGVLLELGHYFNLPALHWLADQAMCYEAQYFRPAGYWLDLRVYADYLAEEAPARLPRATLLVNGGQTPSWAHGTAGIGLVRLRACQLQPAAQYRQESRAALTHTLRHLSRRRGPADYTLGSGLGGQAELLLVAADVLGLDYLRPQAQQVALAAARQRGPWLGKGGREPAEPAGPALFTGTAGIGYFLLRTLQPPGTDSLLLPRLPRGGGARPAPLGPWQATATLRQAVWGRWFERTLALLAQLAPAEVAALFTEQPRGVAARELPALQQHLRELVRALPGPAKTVVQEAFRMEKQALALLRRQPGFIYQAAQARRLARQAQQLAALDEASVLRLSFRLTARVRLLPNRWPWATARPAVALRNLAAPVAAHPVLLVAGPDSVTEFAVGAFSAAVLRAFARPAAAASVFQQLARQLPPAAQGSAAAPLTAALVAQLRHFLAAGFLELTAGAGD